MEEFKNALKLTKERYQSTIRELAHEFSYGNMSDFLKYVNSENLADTENRILTQFKEQMIKSEKVTSEEAMKLTNFEIEELLSDDELISYAQQIERERIKLLERFS